MARGFAHPGVHEIGDATQRRNGTPDPGLTVILDSGSHISARGKHANQVVVAIAREMAAFAWAIARTVPLVP